MRFGNRSLRGVIGVEILRDMYKKRQERSIFQFIWINTTFLLKPARSLI